MKPSNVQNQYYADTAAAYDKMHLEQDPEHAFALSILSSFIEYLNVTSILDVGSGTGRVLQYLNQSKPNLFAVGIEPVKELRNLAYDKGIRPEHLLDGDATNIAFQDGSFDLVCEFAVLHHIEKPEVAIAEMLRVAKKAIFISDTNRFGQGKWAARKIKQGLTKLGLWPIANYLKTSGKRYTLSDGDGVAYSYSVFDNYAQIRSACKSVHFINTIDANINIYDSASHIALLGIKK